MPGANSATPICAAFVELRNVASGSVPVPSGTFALLPKTRYWRSFAYTAPKSRAATGPASALTASIAPVSPSMSRFIRRPPS